MCDVCDAGVLGRALDRTLMCDICDAGVLGGAMPGRHSGDARLSVRLQPLDVEIGRGRGSRLGRAQLQVRPGQEVPGRVLSLSLMTVLTPRARVRIDPQLSVSALTPHSHYVRARSCCGCSFVCRESASTDIFPDTTGVNQERTQRTHCLWSRCAADLWVSGSHCRKVFQNLQIIRLKKFTFNL